MTLKNNKQVIILIADDDEEDRLLLKEAFEESHLLNTIYFADDGEDLMNFLLRKGPYTHSTAPRPGLILLDLNMPKKDGREALIEIKANPELRKIPIVILTTSRAEEDIIRSYDIGVNSFITKPVTFRALLGVVQTLGRYWLEIVELPEIDTE
jgi:CheY-like chemotaxis protein